MKTTTSHRPAAALLLALATFATVACAGSRPRVNVIGVAAPQQIGAPAPTETIVMFVEVVNPTSRSLELQRLEYRFAAESWFDATGQVPLDRAIASHGSAVVEVPVRVQRREGLADVGGDVPYRLDGRLYAVDDRIERSWSVTASGVIEADVVADARRNLAPIKTRVAHGR